VFIAELVPHGKTLVEFSIKIANVAGGLSQVASNLTKHRVNVLSGYHANDEWCFFADITEIDWPLEDVIKDISSLSVVSQVITGEKVSEGLIADSLHKGIKSKPTQIEYLILRADSLRTFLQTVKGIFGPEGKTGRTLVKNMGMATGKQAYNQAVAVLGDQYLRKHVQELMDVYMAQGMGEYKLLNLDVQNAKASVQVSNNFECNRLSGMSSPQGDLTRGYLTGLFSEYFGKRTAVTERRCVARGEENCCYEITSEH